MSSEAGGGRANGRGGGGRCDERRRRRPGAARGPGGAARSAPGAREAAEAGADPRGAEQRPGGRGAPAGRGRQPRGAAHGRAAPPRLAQAAGRRRLRPAPQARPGRAPGPRGLRAGAAGREALRLPLPRRHAGRAAAGAAGAAAGRDRGAAARPPRAALLPGLPRRGRHPAADRGRAHGPGAAGASLHPPPPGLHGPHHGQHQAHPELSHAPAAAGEPSAPRLHAEGGGGHHLRAELAHHLVRPRGRQHAPRPAPLRPLPGLAPAHARLPGCCGRCRAWRRGWHPWGHSLPWDPPPAPLLPPLQIVLHREEEVLTCSCDMPSVHQLLARLPPDLPFERLIARAQDLFRCHPHAELAKQAALQHHKSISIGSFSALQLAASCQRPDTVLRRLRQDGSAAPGVPVPAGRHHPLVKAAVWGLSATLGAAALAVTQTALEWAPEFLLQLF